MKLSPLLFSSTLIASLSLLTIGSAWSAPESQAKQQTAVDVKAKAIKAKTHKAKSSKAKSNKAKTVQKAAPIKLASADTGKFVPMASAVTTNPYLASQPAAILPKAANPYMANPVVTAPIVTTLVAAVPVAPVQVVSVPVAAAPVAAAPVAVQTPAAAMPARAPVAAYQPWNSAPISKNPYLAYQQHYTPPDPAALFNQFGNGLKISWPSFPQSGNSTPWTSNTGSPAMANPTQSAIADATNSFNQIFTSLKMALPSFPQPVVNPSQTALAGTSNSFNQLFTSLKTALPSGLFSGDTTYLPVIKTVYPTGDKPMVVLNFKCPTEMIGVTPPPMKLLHEAVNLGFEGLNKTNLLSFNLLQVCS